MLERRAPPRAYGGAPTRRLSEAPQERQKASPGSEAASHSQQRGTLGPGGIGGKDSGV